GSEVPIEMPDQAWAPFDRQGFAMYRIAMIALASLSVWAVFGVAACLMDSAWALLAAALTFLAPFFAHELFFTWPKFAAATAVLAAFLLTLRKRSIAAGLALGIGHLFHPSAILAAPFLGIFVLVGGSDSSWTTRTFR